MEKKTDKGNRVSIRACIEIAMRRLIMDRRAL